ncbi:MAG: Maf family protein [Myxococcota bacterium]
MSRLVLASTSPYRRALLERLGVPFDVDSPEVDESAWRHLPPAEMARHLAEAKARAITRPGCLVVGSDQVAEIDGDVLGKPGTEARAVEQLSRLSGRAHRLITAVAVHDTDTGRVEADVDVHVLHMRRLDRQTLERYVAHDRPVGCAGAYMLERRGIALFERIDADPDSADDTAIVGLPLTKLCRLLRGFGYDVLAE